MAAPRPAGDGGHHEAQRHEQADADAHHEVQGEALRVGCGVRATASTTDASNVAKQRQRQAGKKVTTQEEAATHRRIWVNK